MKVAADRRFQLDSFKVKASVENGDALPTGSTN